MELSKKPLWLVGFRPFFILAFISGLAMPIIWAFVLDGTITVPDHPFSSVQWHAHEMFFGFGMAVLSGFLLTATKNWVKIRGFFGWPLVFLALAWILERFAIYYAGAWPNLIFLFFNYLFLGTFLVMILWTLIVHRKTDTFGNNFYFILILPILIAAKYFILSPDNFKLGASLCVGIFRMAFLIMLERTLTQFMKNVFQVNILRSAGLDRAIKVLGFALIFEALMPTGIAAFIFLALALLLAYRFIYWHPSLAFTRLDIGIMYLGYLALTVQLFIEFLIKQFGIHFVGTISVHLFTFGVMGFIIPAMLIRISNGHTGRKVMFSIYDKLVLWIMILGFAIRIFATQYFVSHYVVAILAAAICWLLAFSILAFRYVPILLRPRTDGRDH